MLNIESRAQRVHPFDSLEPRTGDKLSEFFSFLRSIAEAPPSSMLHVVFGGIHVDRQTSAPHPAKQSVALFGAPRAAVESLDDTGNKAGWSVLAPHFPLLVVLI